MKCKMVRKLESEYLDGALEIDTRRSFRAHLAACSACSERVKELEEIKGMLRNLEQPEVPEELLSKIESGMENEPFRRINFGVY